MKSIAVTGAGGYLGRHVVKALLDDEYIVMAIDINTTSVDDRAVKLPIDIFNDSNDLYEKMGQPDVLIHLAWMDGFIHNSTRHIEYLPKHSAFLNSMLQAGLKHLVVMGTMHEVGYWEGSIDENTPTNPQSLYGIAKNTLRQCCTIMTQNYPDVFFQWLRAFYIYGDDLKNHSVFTKLLQAVSEGKKTFPFTSGKNLYDFISVEQLAKQIAACATQTEVVGIINCCSGNPISLAQMAESFIMEQSLDIKLEYGAFPDRSYDSPGIWGDNTKIKEVLRLKLKN